MSGFDQIVLMTSGDVNVEVTGKRPLVIEADDNILPLLTTQVVNGRLELGSSGPIAASSVCESAGLNCHTAFALVRWAPWDSNPQPTG